MSEPTWQTPPERVRLAVGVITAPQGLRGEVRMSIWTHFPEHIPEITTIYLNEEETPRRLLAARLHRGIAILRIEGVETRDEAERLRGTVVRISRDQAAPLAEGDYYHYQLLGLTVVDEAGNPLGTVTDIIETGANDVYVVRDEGGRETLIPALRDVVLDIDLERGCMTVRPLRYYDEG
ncbi:MAG: ribosome maturation factor RimM [Sphaerobacter sp.]|nr:ribosome maturation factor RimM [Sphaerobacter sp.]